VAPTPVTEWQEVARKSGEGVEVTLLWNSLLSRVKVAVSDERLCHYVDLDIEADSLSAFQQPFADATSRLVANRVADR
jgi:hypothetical protein